MCRNSTNARCEPHDKLEEIGILEAFTIRLNQQKLGKPLTALITVFMKTTDHTAFQQFLASQDRIEEAYRISGDGCYWVKAHVSSQEELNQLLDEIRNTATTGFILRSEKSNR
ncbi:Lrp/AsnC family transcriptional regulator [Effusibacillus pohliae]|uniref:Lrp/AsnC family transcriptional regulator n=1 Tax=Effusibacillus pohliae TaxID=232270 RepID=UPI0003A3C09D|nr:Lrp/AsnC family transcriptional regulator [Effusibacillus pohliae]